MDLGPLNNFPLLIGTKVLSVGGTRKKLEEEKALLPSSGLQHSLRRPSLASAQVLLEFKRSVLMNSQNRYK